VKEAVERGTEAAGGKDVHIMGGADVIRQALEAGLVDELTIIIAPVVLGGGKRLFAGFSGSLGLEHLGVRQSQYATFVDYRVKRPDGHAAAAVASPPAARPRSTRPRQWETTVQACRWPPRARAAAGRARGKGAT
jgi:RibD C-terminal domain